MRVPCFGAWSSARAWTSSLDARFWNKLTFDHQVRQLKCESVCVPTRLGQTTTWSNTQFVDPRHGYCKQFRDQQTTNSDNISDILAKAIDRQTVDKHFNTVGFVEVQSTNLHKTILMTTCDCERAADAVVATREHSTVSNSTVSSSHTRSDSLSHL